MNVDFWKLLAGLGLFLFGMLLLEESVRAVSGKAFKRIIRNSTNGRLKSIGSGTLITAILQSSSAVSLMVLAFVGAGVMNMENAIGVVMGSSVGTTLTAWIVAAFGFKIKIESFALPFIGIGGIALVFLGRTSKLAALAKIMVGFSLLILGIDYLKTSVEQLAQHFDLRHLPAYGLFFYVMVGLVLTAIMQASSACIAIVLTAMHSHLISFDIAAAMVIGANVGTTLTILVGAIGGSPPKKRVAFSQLLFKVVTASVIFAGLPAVIWFIGLFFEVQNNGIMGLALFHTLFNVCGVLLFFPFVGLLARGLVKLYPDRKAVLTIYLSNTPTEVTDAACSALRKEIQHLLQECQLYNLRLLQIDEKLLFEDDLPFEKSSKKKLTIDSLYENIKLLHAEIFAFYSRLMAQKIEETEAKDLERVIFASRNIMNSIKNFKSIRSDLDEFDGSENQHLNSQYMLFRKRLLEFYHDLGQIMLLESKEEQYVSLLKAFVRVDEADKRFIRETMGAVAAKKIRELEISSLLLANRLFTQACRLQVFSLKDLLLSQKQITDFDRAMDMKEILDEEKAKIKTDSALLSMR